jgi:hypothetical protein
MCVPALRLGDWYPGRDFLPAPFNPLHALRTATLEVKSRKSQTKRRPQPQTDSNKEAFLSTDKDLLLDSIQGEPLSTDRALFDQAELVLKRTDQELVGFNRLVDRLRRNGFEKNLVPDSALYEQSPKPELKNWYSMAKSRPNDFVDKVIQTAFIDLEHAMPP